MKRWRIAQLLIGVCTAAAIIAAARSEASWWILIAVLACWLAFTAFASMVLRAGIFACARCHGAPGTLALTFDDGPHPEHTPPLLDLLREHDVRATFFCIGRNVAAHPALATRIVREGHAIGIHTQDHRFNWGFLSTAKASAQIERCALAIEQATGQRTRLLRPPFGVTNPAIARAIARTGVELIGWDLRTFDTVRSPAAVLHRVRQSCPPATIVVLHDTVPGTVPLVRGIIEHCRRKGIALVAIDQTRDPRS